VIAEFVDEYMEARAREEKARVAWLRWLETMEASLAEYRLAYLWWTARDGVRSVGNAGTHEGRERARAADSPGHIGLHRPAAAVYVTVLCDRSSRERSSPVRAARSSTPAATGPMRPEGRGGSFEVWLVGRDIETTRFASEDVPSAVQAAQLPKASGRGEKHSKLGSARRSRSFPREGGLGDRRGTVAGGAPAQRGGIWPESVGSRLGLEAGNAGGLEFRAARAARAGVSNAGGSMQQDLRVKARRAIELLVCGFHSESPSATSHESAANYNRTRAVWERCSSPGSGGTN